MSVNDPKENSEVISELQGTVKDLVSRLEKSESTNARLLDESYKSKQKYNEVRDKYSELEDIRKDKLTAEERLEESRREVAAQAKRLAEQSDNLFEMNVKSQIRKFAPDAQSLEAVMGMTSKKGLLKFDEENNTVTDDSAQEFINAIREDHNYLFRKEKVPTMGDGSKPKGEPGFSTMTEKLSSNGLKGMTNDDLVGALRENWKPRATKA